MSELDLDAIEARANAATEGPWEVDTNQPFSDEIVGIFVEAERRYAVKFDFDDQPNASDAEFIAHAREDVPALVARVRELEGAVEQVRAYASIDRLPEPYRANVLRALEGATEAPDPAPEVPGFEGTLDALDGLTIRKGDD